MTTRKKLVLAGLGVVLVVGTIYWFQRRRNGLGKIRQILDRYPEAPAIDGYSNGDMKTELRASAEMPIEQRLASIQRLIYLSVQDPAMREIALQITNRCPERDGMCEARAVYEFVKKRVRYSGDIAPLKMPNGDIEGIDAYQAAKRTIQFGAGDCDDQSILVATLLTLNGITARLRVMKESKSADWSHIYPVGMLPKGEDRTAVVLDTTLPGNRFDVEPPSAEIVEFPA